MNESMEMYLETVLILERDHGHAHGVDIAKKLGVTKPSVTKAMKALKSNGLIDQESYGTITLTDKGKECSEKILSSHKLIAKFLMHSLNLTQAQASENACKMEHIITTDMIESIKTYLSDYSLSIKEISKEV